MKLTRRDFSKLAATGLAVAAAPGLFAPALAQDKPLRIGIIAPDRAPPARSASAASARRDVPAERINTAGGIAGRKVELVVEEETNPKDSIERLRKLVLQDKVDCVQGIVSSGVSLAMGARRRGDEGALIFWDGTTQDGVKETMPNPRYVFRSTDNECEAVMGRCSRSSTGRASSRRRRHQPGLLVRPQQLRGVPGAAGEASASSTRSSPTSGRRSARST